MDSQRFDRMTKLLASGASRRSVLKRLAATTAAGALAAIGVGDADAAPRCKAGTIYCPEDVRREVCIHAAGGPYVTSADCPAGQSFNCGGCGPAFTCPCGFRCCEGTCQPITTCPHCGCCGDGTCGCLTEEQYADRSYNFCRR